MKAHCDFMTVIASVQRVTAKVLMGDERNQRPAVSRDPGFKFGPHGCRVEATRVSQNEVFDRFTGHYGPGREKMIGGIAKEQVTLQKGRARFVVTDMNQHCWKKAITRWFGTRRFQV